MRKTIIFSLVLLLGCSVPYKDNIFDDQQPGIENCYAACQNIQSLDCWGNKAQTCEIDCENEHAEGYFWNTECLLNINSCEEIVSVCKSIIKYNDCG